MACRVRSMCGYKNPEFDVFFIEIPVSDINLNSDYFSIPNNFQNKSPGDIYISGGTKGSSSTTSNNNYAFYKNNLLRYNSTGSDTGLVARNVFEIEESTDLLTVRFTDTSLIDSSDIKLKLYLTVVKVLN